MTAPAPPTDPPRPASAAGSQPRVIARQLALGFGLVSAVSIAMCALLLLLLSQVGGLVGHMRHDEHAIRLGAELSTAVREQYIVWARGLIDGQATPEAAGPATARVKSHLDGLAERVPADERWRIDEIRAESAEMDRLFRTRLSPALARGDRDALRAGHAEVAEIAARAAVHADAVAEAVEGRMAGAHTSTTDVTRIGLIAGLIGAVLVLGLAVGYTVRLRRSVLQPLRQLTEAAHRIGAGGLDVRVGRVGRGELQQVATAFDHMADELVAREQRLLRAERMAAIGQLAAGVAHEMNNPIGIIRGYLKTMSPDEEPTVLAEELRILDEEAAACQRIADDLLAYARTPEMSLAPIEMGPWIEEAVRRLAETGELGAHPVQVEAEPGTAPADSVRLRQVLANLLLNAVQASPPERPVEVRGQRRLDGGYALTVSDRGPGVDPADRARVFEPFFSGRAGGSGLGLAVCQGIVSAHRGRLSVADRPGGGAIFRVELPPAPPPLEAPP